MRRIFTKTLEIENINVFNYKSRQILDELKTKLDSIMKKKDLN